MGASNLKATTAAARHEQRFTNTCASSKRTRTSPRGTLQPAHTEAAPASYALQTMILAEPSTLWFQGSEAGCSPLGYAR